MRIVKEQVKQQFLAYTDCYDRKDPKVRLKIDHTLRVAGLADRIEESELPAQNTGVGWLLGMLHDIGRFEQLRRYHTFSDSRSIDHAEFGADLLFREGMIGQFLAADEEECRLLEKAIRLHNKLDLPADLTDRERFYCNVIRDADKIDILRVICETPFDDIYDCTREELAGSPVTDEVFRQAMQRRTVDRAVSRTPMDSYLNKITFVYGLVFEESRRLVQQQGYLRQMLDYHSQNAETERRLEAIRQDIRQYLKES